MRRFTALYDALDQTTRLSEKQAALEMYFRDAPPEDAAWALSFLCGRRPRRAVTHAQLRRWASEESAIPAWLVDESYEAVGDLSETLALLLPDRGEHHIGNGAAEPSLSRIITERLLPLSSSDEGTRRALLARTWRELPARQRFVFHKLISGSFRVGAARGLVVRALAAVASVDPAVMDHRLLGPWKPTAEDFRSLIAGHGAGASDEARPYPFFLASPLFEDPSTLGDIGAWRAEWKWDGIRAQIIRRGAETLIWSRGEELIGPAFPEVVDAARSLPAGTVIDGELLAWDAPGGRPLPFSALQLRLNRKAVAPMLFPDVPVRFIAYDLLEEHGDDARSHPLDDRIARLMATIAALDHPAMIAVLPPVDAASWSDLAAARESARQRGVEGLMLKRRASTYSAGRTRGDWWKWKVDPLLIDAVMTHAQHGSGIRAGLYTDYTFGLWHENELVTIAKAYSGLTNQEIAEVDAFVRKNTLSRHGPVRMVQPELVFELAFDAVQESTRHKSGLALRFPRMNRWRRDKPASQADSLETLKALYRASMR